MLDTAHGDDGGCPVDHHGVAQCLGGGDAPGVGIGTQGGSGAKKGNHFGDGGGTVGVGEVATLGGFHHVPAPPEIVKGLIHGHLTNAVLVCQFDTAVNRLVGN